MLFEKLAELTVLVAVSSIAPVSFNPSSDLHQVLGGTTIRRPEAKKRFRHTDVDIAQDLSAEALRPALHNKYAMLVVLSGKNLAPTFARALAMPRTPDINTTLKSSLSAWS